MMPLCCLDNRSPLIVDTGVAINLCATGCADAIIKSIPNSFVIVNQVKEALEREIFIERENKEFIIRLVDLGIVKICGLGEVGTSVFECLVSGGAAVTLGDGESATIALAVEASGVVLIDDRKSEKICRDRYPDLSLASTVDLFAHPQVQAELGQARITKAVFNALRKAHMSIPACYLEWVVGLIGPERTALCSSLPRRFKGI